jgi:hypothetical protein
MQLALGRYWKVGEFEGHPVYMQEPKPGRFAAPVAFQHHHAWWICTLDPLPWQKHNEPKWLAKAEISCNAGTMDWAPMDWYFPPSSTQKAKFIEVMPNSTWINEHYKKLRRSFVSQLNTMAADRVTIINLKAELNANRARVATLTEQLARLNAQPVGLQPDALNWPQPQGLDDKGKGKGKGAGGKGDGVQVKTGWLNKMVALIGAIDSRNWQRVYHLCDAFLGCICKQLCTVALMLTCVVYVLVYMC